MKKSQLRAIIREEILALTKSKTMFKEYDGHDFIEDEDFAEEQDEYTTDTVSRANLDKVIDLLMTAKIAFYVNERAKTIAFDITELKIPQQLQVAKLLDIYN
jgi:hypothetical protein